ncbi:MAG: hypothetical protein N2663_07755 [Chlorobi bacterium]|nr:hypothetical protein [Chlorobiota bacterium]
MTRRCLWAAGFVLATLSGCAATQITPLERITLGSGGGIAGIRSGYRIERSGMIEQWETHGESMHIRAAAKVPSTNVRDIFARAAALGADTLQLDRTGNVTYWLELTSARRTVRLRWTDPDAIPPHIAVFYRELLERCQNAIDGK